MSTSHKLKYRPYFSAPDMLELISALKQNPSPKRLAIIQYLESFSLKINHGLIEPSHILKPSLSESMGFSSPSDSPNIPAISPLERRYNAYIQWSKDPNQCTPSQLKDSYEYRFANKLLSPEEQKEFEKSLNLGF